MQRGNEVSKLSHQVSSLKIDNSQQDPSNGQVLASNLFLAHDKVATRSVVAKLFAHGAAQRIGSDSPVLEQ